MVDLQGCVHFCCDSYIYHIYIYICTEYIYHIYIGITAEMNTEKNIKKRTYICVCVCVYALTLYICAVFSYSFPLWLTTG